MKKMLQEKKIFKLIIIAVVLLIPIIYSFFYLKSYWNPYGNLKDVKVAMINLDNGTRGKDLIKSMQEAENTLGFVETESEEALNGLATDKYYAIITIPQDFSKNLESAGEEYKQKTTIVFTPNKRKNYLSYQIINSALKTAEIQIQSKVAGEVADTMADKLKEVPDSLDKIDGGIGQIEEGSVSLTSGLGKISDGVSTLNTKYSEFDTGIKTASEGSKDLTNGITTLKTSIEDGKNTATEQIKKLNGIKEFVEDPIEFKEESFGEVESYGVAFTPLFLSIGLWVGALMLYVVIYYDPKHRFGILDHDNVNKILQNCIYLGIAAVEGLITGLVLKALLGFSVASMGMYLFECILVGMAFTIIIQFLIRNFGDIGKFLALIILVLQLAASGGTFPVETIDKSFQAFTSWLPMTYSIRIFKDCLIPTDASLLGGNTLVILAILIILFIINTVIEFIKEKNKNTSTETIQYNKNDK